MSHRESLLAEPIHPFLLEIRLGQRLIGQHRLEDPFHRTSIVIGWQDLLRALLRREMRIRVDLWAGHWDVTRRMFQTLAKWEEEGWPEQPPARSYNVEEARHV